MNDNGERRTVWQPAKISDVVRFYAESFSPDDNETVEVVDWWLDPTKGEIVFCLSVETTPTDEESPHVQ